MNGKIQLIKYDSDNKYYVESEYQYDYVITKNGKIIDKNCDETTLVSLRSAAKPFLIIPLLHNNGIEKFSLDSKILAMMISSHNGESFHRCKVKEYLLCNNLSIDDLNCGTHLPYYYKEINEFFKCEDEKEKKLFNNCSGKHLMILLLSKILGIKKELYWEKNSYISLIFSETMKKYLQFYKDKSFYITTDGCGIPNYFVSMATAALSYEKIHEIQDYYKVINAVKKEPLYFAGNNRIESELIDKLDIFIKSGSEGLFCASIPSQNIGICIKIKSGNEEASEVAISAIIDSLNIFNKKCEQEILKKWQNLNCYTTTTKVYLQDNEYIYTNENILIGKYTYLK